MESSHREIILKNIDFLTDNTSDEAFERLLELFSSNRGLSPYMLEKIKKGTSLERKRKFYEMVPKRGPEAFHKLCDCLYRVDLKNLAEKLRGSRVFLEGCFPSKRNGSSDERDNNNEEHYIIKSNPKGHVLIINIKNYLGNPQDCRSGSEKDVSSLEELWKNLGYSVKTYQDLKYEEFMKVIVDFIDLTESEMLDSVFVFIMTHGKRGEPNNREVLLQMSDLQYISSEWILDKFTSFQSKHLADTPKVIFIQACRGVNRDWGVWLSNDLGLENVELIEGIDATKMVSLNPRYSNLLMVFSTLPGHVAKRYDTGAPFIQELCHIIKKKSKNTHLLDMIHEVNRNLKEEVQKKVKPGSFFQTVHYENWCFNYKLYL